MEISGRSGFLHKQQCCSAGMLWCCVASEKKSKLRISIFRLNNDDVIILHNIIKGPAHMFSFKVSLFVEFIQS